MRSLHYIGGAKIKIIFLLDKFSQTCPKMNVAYEKQKEPDRKAGSSL